MNGVEHMPARMLESKPMVAKFKEEIRNEVEKLKEKGIEPRLATVMAGWDGPSKAYALSKEKTCKSLGINFSLNLFEEDATEEKVTDAIRTLNKDSDVHGIMLELPLPKNINAHRVISTINPKKDVDGITPVNRGLLLMGKLDEALLPVTPLSCITLIESADPDIAGKNLAIIGRGETVGLPLTILLIKKHATVTICHSKTKNLAGIVKNSDIVVAATGQAGLIKVDMLREGQIVVDAGISVLPDGKLVGDVEAGAADVVSHLSPVPGGVGSLTVMLLLKNLFKAIGLQNGSAA
ncbi:MAG: bifunctional 5,10-methylenetetrahydrofolate dehydrogenase/5,10-methenyltetrahydrofolate cyclohydrolase [Deltaproteobacteria bacterium]|jgi:methylenetetrahydrofolate dehydrogenase (NADP+)/methenyltetrahydrofolate cyclohydrolase|nr:bifunctional 5,10-methylenetetrahydrofolate dehydrogenase/5,10-methenyltetrahydrofolate cyclohydrolase [Deltaproteobacteria bacterium]